MARGQYPRLTTSREKIFELTGEKIPRTRTDKDGNEYVVKIIPRCIPCKGVPVRKLYRINPHYRKLGIPRYEHRAYECPDCGTLFSRKIVEKKVEVFEGDEH